MVYEIVIVFLSLLVGWFIASKTKEELKPGKVYFRLLCSLILLTFNDLILINYFSLLTVIGIAIGLIIGIFLINPYFYLGLLAFMTYVSFDKGVFSILTFLFSLSYLSLFFDKLNKKFFILTIVLFLLPYLLFIVKDSFDLSFVYGVAVGGFIHVIRRNYKRH